MRLKKIKLAGFKSFVDPTTVDFMSNRVGIVGPNGCGKSNVIDAVRWVMGETSAKQLRGESMADVIFNGSGGRAPVGQASVELIFDNSDGSLGGEYAAFGEIAIKRMVTRDGQSNYYLNNARCRRKDITDIFLGTGLGPRSYAIIEQGMISRLIDAKPEDLRIFLEEAAGISKYKERRRETETRIRHTEENLDRLNDLRDEIGKQLIKLEKQAEAAEKYKELKKNLRQVSAEHLALKWRDFDIEMNNQHRDLAEREILVDKEIAKLREIDANIEKQRVAYDAAQEDLQKTQSQYYRTAAIVGKHEQALEHQRERQAQLDMDLAQLSESYVELENALESDQQQYETMQSQLNALTPQSSEFENQFKYSSDALMQAESAMQSWQTNADILNQQLAHENQKVHVAQEKLSHLQNNINAATTRLDLLTEQHQELSNTDLAASIHDLQTECANSDEQLTDAKNNLATLQSQIQNEQAENEKVQSQVDKTRDELQTLHSEAVSLQALQSAAFGQEQDAAKSWLAHHHLDDKQRLAQQLVVDPEWICAVETVLGHYLQAICVDAVEMFMENLSQFSQGSLVLFENKAVDNANRHYKDNALLHKIKTNLLIDHLLQDVYYANTLTEALQMRAHLAPHESVVTKEGIWMSPQWVRVSRTVDEHAGVLGREQRLQILQPRIEELKIELQQLQQDFQARKEQIKFLTEQLSQSQQALNQKARLDTDLQAQLRALQVKQEQVLNQKQKISIEIDELKQQIEQQHHQLEHTQALLLDAQTQSAALAQDKQQLETSRQQLSQDLQQAKSKAQQDQENSNRVQMQLSGIHHRLEATKTHLFRSEQQLEKLKAREDQLKQARAAAGEPIDTITLELEAAIDQQVQDETAMQAARGHVDATAHELRNQEQSRSQTEENVQSLRSVLEEFRLALQTIRVKRDGVAEQLQLLELQAAPLLEQLPENAQVQEWAQKEERLEAQIKRLGAINLAAIDEYAEHAERLNYLNKQDEDLRSALATLQEAMEKIDKETKERFKETFDTVNANFTQLFKQVFSGGNASLELTEQDLLNTGIAIMAQPPGKRNSSIHILSGGEKALTAISLVFALFKLNPAPFCMLDEVDAPLDDANVMRYARLVKEMSEYIQFIFITHSKGTMEIADQLMGVTMKEAGVSRLVSVDVEKASELAVA